MKGRLVIDMKLSIIIPVYNEEKTISKIIARVREQKLPKEITREIIVVNDASSDKTSAILKKIKGIKILNHKKNLGKGAAIRTALNKSKGDIILIQDADLEYDPNDYKKLLAPIVDGDAKVVYGTRIKEMKFKLFGEGKTPLPTHYIANKFLSMLTRVLYGGEVTDMETCYKIIRASVIKDVKLKSNRFDFEPEVTAKILKKGVKIHEIPIKTKPRGYDEGKKIGWKDGVVAVWTLLKYRFVD